MKKLFLLLTMLLCIGLVVVIKSFAAPQTLTIRSIDTMKASRDLAREELPNPAYDAEIDKQMEQIAEMGATHVAIGTPYDDEFLPMLRRWVAGARNHQLKVWFRGNFSGWEQWFNYPKIDRKTHIRKIEAFIEENKDLFVDGDVFTSCPECENGGPGDPRNGDVVAYRTFLIEEYTATKKAFQKIGKRVIANYYSMNGDVAKLVMDKETTKKLDGVITVDHYVATPEQLAEDVKEYARLSGGKVVLGEIGVPIPDINGVMSEEDQAQWMAKLFGLLGNDSNVVGINYWVHLGGTTALFTPQGEKKRVTTAIKNFYTNASVLVEVVDKDGNPIPDATVTQFNSSVKTKQDGTVYLPYMYGRQEIQISATGYKSASSTITSEKSIVTIVLQGDGSKKDTIFVTAWKNFIDLLVKLLTR